MDPLTAIGLAANIIQFVDFTAKLLNTTKTLYQSTSGQTRENADLGENMEEMRSFARRLAPEYPHEPLTEEEESMQRLATKCGLLCNEIIELVGKATAEQP